MHYPPYPNTSEGGPPLFPGYRMGGWTVAMITVGALVGVVLLGLFGTLVAYIWASGKVHENMRFPGEDVTVTFCGRDEVTGRPVAGVRVASGAARPGTYTVHVVFRDLRSGKGRGVDAGRAVRPWPAWRWVPRRPGGSPVRFRCGAARGASSGT